MDLEVIEEVLFDYSNVLNVHTVPETSFQGKDYQKIIECDLTIVEELVPIVIAIPQNWSRILVDIYVKQYMDFPFIPHIDVKGKICLFDLEGTLIDQNLCGIILQSIKRAREIIMQGLAGTNREEFINEFDSYWIQLPSVRLAKFDVPDVQGIKIVKYFAKNIKRRNKEKYIDFLQRSQKSTIYISQNPEDLNPYYSKAEKITIRNSVYINIIIDDFLFPPDGRLEITKEYIQGVLKYLDVKEFQSIISKLGNDKLMVLKIHQPNGEITFLGFLLEKCEFSFDTGMCVLKSVDRIFPIAISRIDKQYLMMRSNEISNILADKRILLIGCGSLGGYIANELAKTGIENIMLVDDDYLYEFNIFRHLLGIEYVGRYKCEALQKYLQKNIHKLKVTSLAENIEDAVQEESIEFEQYDLIISATGSHNINRWINQYVLQNKIATPVIYAWNETLGIGNHVTYIKYGNKGCYECFFGRDEDSGELYDRTSYCQPGQNVVQKVAGCGSAFIPYGSTISLKTACMCIDTVKKIFEGRYVNNVIISAKGDDYYFKKAGLEVSNKYLKQKTSVVEYEGILFRKQNCKFCGAEHGNQ